MKAAGVCPTRWTGCPLRFVSLPIKTSSRVHRSEESIFKPSKLGFIKSTNSSRIYAVAEEEGDVKNSFDDFNVAKVGACWEGRIKSTNKGGVIITTSGGRGFCPYSKLDPSRLKTSGTQLWGEVDQDHLKGESIKCLVQDINAKGQPVLSEKAYYMSRVLDYYKPGDTFEGKVVGMEDYGVFVDVPSEDGEFHGVRGLIHISELSWDVVTRPEDVISIGDDVTATVRNVSRNLNRLELTLKTDDSDPLKESVSSLLPLEGEALANMTWEPLEDMIPELNAIIENLLLQQGIEDVQPRRQAEVQHKVSKDLEIWLSKEEVEDGFNLVARSGRTLQEINVRTDFTRDEMKSVLEQVLRQAM